jgi:hypothetical protein
MAAWVHGCMTAGIKITSGALRAWFLRLRGKEGSWEAVEGRKGKQQMTDNGGLQAHHNDGFSFINLFFPVYFLLPIHIPGIKDHQVTFF